MNAWFEVTQALSNYAWHQAYDFDFQIDRRKVPVRSVVDMGMTEHYYFPHLVRGSMLEVVDQAEAG